MAGVAGGALMAWLDLGGRRFEIEEATLSGWLNTLKQDYCVGLQWSLEIVCAEREIDEDFWKPRLGVQFPAAEIGSWIELEGLSRRWNGADAEAQDINPGFYNYTHENISRGDVRIGSRDEARFDIDWSGVTDVYWDEQFGADVPFALHCAATFTGITALGDAKQNAESLAGLLAAETSLDALAPGQFRIQRHKRGKPRNLRETLARWIVPSRRGDLVSTLAEFVPRATD